MNKIALKYFIPNIHYFSDNWLKDKYQDCRDNLTNELNTIEWFTVTNHFWISCTEVSYISFTLHY